MGFIGRDGGAVFVDLRLHPVHRVHDGGRGPRRACDLDEVKRDGRLRKPVPDSIPVPSAYEPGRENRDVEGPEGSGNVYTFAARKRYTLWRPVAVPERQVRDDEGPVHRGVKGDCQDHSDIPLFPKIIVSRPPGIYHTFSKKNLLASFFCNKLLHTLAGHGGFSMKSSRRMVAESLKPGRTRSLTGATMDTLCVPRLPLEPAKRLLVVVLLVPVTKRRVRK